MMAAPKRLPAGSGGSGSGGGVSKDTQALLASMMHSAGLTERQKRTLAASAAVAAPLPTVCNPYDSRYDTTGGPAAERSAAAASAAAAAAAAAKSGRVPVREPQIRTREQMEAQGAFEPETYRGAPVDPRRGREKERLANVMAFGSDVDPERAARAVRERFGDEDEDGGDRGVDEFDVIVGEIRERREFLDDMRRLGRGAEVEAIINSQISQRVRQLEVIDKQRSTELEQRLRTHTK
jgi:hypothetical protein